MGRSSRPIRKAKYVGPDYRGEIKANEVTDRQKKLGRFYCEDCGVELIHVSGSVSYFKLFSGTSHNPNCYYFIETDNIETLIREVGVDNIQIKITPKNYDKNKSTEINTEDIIEHDLEKTKSVNRKYITISNPNKKRTFFMNTVERLFHVQDSKIKEAKIIIKKLVKNRRYYSTKKYEQLLNDFNLGYLKHPFFVVGFLHQKQYFNLKENGFVEITNARYNYIPIILRIKGKNKEFMFKRIKDITWYIKNSANKNGYVGVLGEVTEVQEENGKTIINIAAYDFDMKLPLIED
jgi:hypothetical protein